LNCQYWNRPEETGEILKEGWFATGDIAKMDGDGYFYYPRPKKGSQCSGSSAFPAEVENFLYHHPSVKEVAVIGVPDPYRAENIKGL